MIVRIILLLFICNVLLITKNRADGKNSTKVVKFDLKHKQDEKVLNTNDDHREKRAIDEEEEFNPFWVNRGKKRANELIDSKNTHIDDDLDARSREYKSGDNLFNDEPFWGNRGRRGEMMYLQNTLRDFDMFDHSEQKDPLNILLNSAKDNKNCKHGCQKKIHKIHAFRDRREETAPFWGNRGRRDVVDYTSDDYTDSAGPFWGNRGRRSDDEDPFWGARGRRDDDLPFWGNRGRRDSDLQFWGSRGRREDPLPFWGNRGRRGDLRTFLNVRERPVKEHMNFPANEDDSLYLYDPIESKSFVWNNRGRDSKLLKYLFGKNNRARQQNPVDPISKGLILGRNKDSETVLDGRIYAEEPDFVILDKFNRGVTDDDPYFTMRGKKKIPQDLSKAARDRRGTIEEIVKSVKTDPYYIARGKKGYVQNSNNSGNSTPSHTELAKTKELICSTIGLLNAKHDNNKFKREIDDDNRDSRMILKKLAAQLQADPYFVSRGKKNQNNNPSDEYLDGFIIKISEMCT